MIRPTLEEFYELARDHSVVPVWRELVADYITPVAAFDRLCGDGEPGFLLESVEHAERWSRWSFLGRRAAATLVLRDGAVTVEGGQLPDGIRLDQGILVALEDVLARYRSPQIDELPPLHGGLVGFLGYDVEREVEHLPAIRATRRSTTPTTRPSRASSSSRATEPPPRPRPSPNRPTPRSPSRT
jgi:anthranilate synthase component I